MSYDRILVDGYSVIHGWPELAKQRRKNFSGARESLVRQLAAFAAHSGQEVTVVFDGTKQREPVAPPQIPHCEVVYSSFGETADDVIERYVGASKNPSRLLVVTDDVAEQQTVQSFGAFTSSAEFFRVTVEDELSELERRVRQTRAQTKTRFRRP